MFARQLCRWISHAAPVSSCLSANGSCALDRESRRGWRVHCLIQRCRSVRAKSRMAPARSAKCTRVVPGGTLPCIGTLAEALGTRLGAALRMDFEWYYCRGAFFHNDAHYDARLFGVWCIEGPPMQLVFPRAALRLAVAPTSVVIFDPFEVHGVLAPGCARMPQGLPECRTRACSWDSNSTSPRRRQTLSISKTARAGA